MLLSSGTEKISNVMVIDMLSCQLTFFLLKAKELNKEEISVPESGSVMLVNIPCGRNSSS